MRRGIVQDLWILEMFCSLNGVVGTQISFVSVKYLIIKVFRNYPSSFIVFKTGKVTEMLSPSKKAIQMSNIYF
jgi:hypothetical protein